MVGARYQAWQLESRARWVATSVALRAVIVFLFLFLLGSSAQRALMVTAIFAVVAGLIWWFWAYPRERAKNQRASVQTTHP